MALVCVIFCLVSLLMAIERPEFAAAVICLGQLG
jgi:hypothetical protein